MAAWAGLGYYARARNLKKCAEAVARDHDGVFPDTEEGLKSLPGIGDYTAAAVAAIAFNRQAAVMDGNVERVISRLYAIATPLPAAKPLMKQKVALLTPADRPGDFAQAMMDLGATICTPKRPACSLCPFRGCVRGAAAARSRAFPGQGGQEGKAGPPWRRLRRGDGGRRHPAAAAHRKRPARRHDRSADDGLDGAAGRRRRRPTPRLSRRPGSLAGP